MNLDTYLSTQETATNFASRVGAPMSSISNWRRKKRPIPLNWVLIIEKETSGLVTRKDLRPKDWAEIWPELAQQDKSNKAA